MLRKNNFEFDCAVVGVATLKPPTKAENTSVCQDVARNVLANISIICYLPKSMHLNRKKPL